MESTAGGRGDAGGAVMMRFASSGSSAECVTNGPVYLTNVVCYFTTNAGWTVGFDIAGGTNGVPYDIFTTTNLIGDSITNAQWEWNDVGYTCNSYTFTNQPTNQTFFILGTPLDSDHDGLTDAYEQLVSKTLVSTNDTDGDGMPDQWEWQNGLNPLVNDASDDPDGDWITNLQEYAGGTNATNPHDLMVVAWGNNNSDQCNVPLYLRNPAFLAGGMSHTFVLQSNGLVTAWGDNTRGQTSVPPGLSNVIAIASGPYHGLALRADGSVTNWGAWFDISYHAVTLASGLTNIVGIAAGTVHDLALRADGTVAAWGYTNETFTSVPTNLTSVKAIAAGWEHNVALRTDGTVVAWGENHSAYGWNLTNPPAGLSNVVAIAAGIWHTLALRGDGTVVAWGAGNGTNLSGNLNNSEQGQSVVPFGLSNVVAIAAGGYHSFALKADGTLVAWGDLAAPSFGSSNLVAIGSGVNHGLALRSGRLTPIILKQPTDQAAPTGGNVTFTAQGLGLAEVHYQWQFNGTNIAQATNATLTLNNVQTTDEGSYRVIFSTGAGSVTSSVATFTLITPPVIISQTQPDRQWVNTSVFLSVQATGPFLTYQWKLEGTDISSATASNYSVPLFYTSAERHYSVIVSNAAGTTNSQTWSVRAYHEGGVAGWGRNDDGELDWPANATNLLAVAAGEFHSVAVKEDGSVVQWGYPWADIPSNLTNATAVAAGYDHTLALRADGTVVAWGDAGSVATNVPANLSGVTAIAAGWSHNLALLTNGTVTAWGINLFGALNVPATLTNATAICAGAQHSLALRSDGTVVGWGDNDASQASVPAGLNNVVGIAAGGSHSLAVKADGTVTAWGLNTSGQCTVPGGLSNVMAVAAGWAHSVALKNDGTAVCWGNNTSGQTNMGAGLRGIKAIAAGGDHTLAGIFSTLVQYPVDVTKDLLLIYNSTSTNSIWVKDYYLAHRPMVSGANVLGIGGPTNDIYLPDQFLTNCAAPIGAWLGQNPTKRPQYVVLFSEIPERVNENNVTGSFPSLPSVSYTLNQNWTGWRPFVNHIHMGDTNAVKAYIDKLEFIGTNYSRGKLVISASAGNYGNTNYVVDDVGHRDSAILWPVTNALQAAGVSPLSIRYEAGYEFCLTYDTNDNCLAHLELPHLTNVVNVAGYLSWGAHSELQNYYALPSGKVKWQGRSSWWIIETIESYNGQRYGDQGNFIQWFSPNAFGGTNYSNTPVGAVTHVEEPSGSNVNDPTLYFGLWAGGKSFGIAAWNSRRTPYFQAVGDPFVKP